MSHSTDHSGASHGSVKSYMTGFILSIILTVIPFAMVMSGSASHAVILGTILVDRCGADRGTPRVLPAYEQQVR
ncbi:Cytochrome o ubiquinol oxidase protein CyoD [Serratia liquefaciens]|nr:Cytochrome o ubiquinol oxidase protein CyoD [Serratia liquefaciens]